ncbi:hypothetical protein TNCV_2973271 [Trichonephila clavipes]|nr:hypothetical protein TNCV_2973271 [Trichonephila clavipes]
MKNFKHVHKTDFEKRYIENSQFNIVSIEKERFPTPLNAEPSLWEALPEQDLTFDDYVLVDTDIAVWGALYLMLKL